MVAIGGQAQQRPARVWNEKGCHCFHCCCCHVWCPLPQVLPEPKGWAGFRGFFIGPHAHCPRVFRRDLCQGRTPALVPAKDGAIQERQRAELPHQVGTGQSPGPARPLPTPLQCCPPTCPLPVLSSSLRCQPSRDPFPCHWPLGAVVRSLRPLLGEEVAAAVAWLAWAKGFKAWLSSRPYILLLPKHSDSQRQ